MEYTFAIIKPDAVESGYAPHILTSMSNNFTVTDVLMTVWDIDMAGRFYAEHIGKPYFGELTRFMSSGPLVCVVLVGEDAVNKWRILIGSTDPEKAKPGTMRSLYGRRGGPVMYNAVHGSDSAESADREIRWVREAADGRRLPGFGDLGRARAQIPVG